MAVDPERLREGMRFWATGVSIVSSHHEQVRHGMTVSSFTSLALTPPLVLISLGRSTRTCELVENSGNFGVTILAHDQLEISDRFAGRQTEHSDRFAGLETFTLVTGTPFLHGGLANFDCRVVSNFESGRNMVFVGEVVAVRTIQDKRPLLYFNRDYRRLQD